MFMISVRELNQSRAGMVLTVEPGIYIEEEQMGVRIENNFWITKNGNKDLMKNIPYYSGGDRNADEEIKFILPA